jgi:peptidyl-prolyl cis-trans isomerase B (cyclophilin B)
MKRLLLAAALLAASPAAAGEDDPEPRRGGNVCAVETSLGAFHVELYPDKAPATVKNFLAYVDKKFYDGLVFHRVIEGFVIQGGGYKEGLAKAGNPAQLLAKTAGPIKCESDNGLSNERGTLAMARAAAADSATSQFFVNAVDNAGTLDRANARDGVGYCVFGKVIKGMDVVDKIRKVRTVTVGELNDVPAEDVVIKSVRRARR